MNSHPPTTTITTTTTNSPTNGQTSSVCHCSLIAYACARSGSSGGYSCDIGESAWGGDGVLIANTTNVTNATNFNGTVGLVKMSRWCCSTELCNEPTQVRWFRLLHATWNVAAVCAIDVSLRNYRLRLIDWRTKPQFSLPPTPQSQRSVSSTSRLRHGLLGHVVWLQLGQRRGYTFPLATSGLTSARLASASLSILEDC